MRKKVLVTGSGGFVGPYLIRELTQSNYEVFGVDRSPGSTYQADLLDINSLNKLMQETTPDYICHLAGFSSVKDSFDKPELCRKINVEGTANLLSAVQKYCTNPRVLIISSAHVYGEPEYVPIDELHPLNPNSPYAKSRVEQENLLNDFDLDIVISRSFNHTGPDQQTGFVCPDFINEAKRLLSGEIESIKVGNLEAKRDISDVRDVVNAYKLLLEKGERHSIYNVCSGSAISIQYILDKVLEIAGIDSSKVEIDKEKYRPIDVEEMYGDNSKMKNLGWEPKYKIEKTLEDMWIS